ncbi:hypothetical protein B4096_3139 [Heyndrickxia coagulans]|nr:hypothetical protein B4096_3139 [Heyndrickxia coagulans]
MSGKKAAWAAFFFNTAGPKKGKRAYVWHPFSRGKCLRNPGTAGESLSAAFPAL